MTLPKRKIMLIGSSGSGKDTMAELISEIVPNCHSLAFAKEVKVLAEKIIKFVDNAEGTNLSLTQSLPDEDHRALMRPLWQWLGTDLFRKYEDTDFWIKKIDQKIKDIETDYATNVEGENNPSFVVTDCRYKNEYQWGIDNGFVIVRVQGEWRQPTGLPGHSSEKDHLGLEEHLLYKNNRSVKDMRNWISDVLVPFCRHYWYDLPILKEEI